MSMIKKIVLIVILVIVALVLFTFAKENLSPNREGREVSKVTNFEECVAEGNAVMESYPRQCISKSGEHFVEEVEIKSDSSEETSFIDINSVSYLLAGKWRSLEDEKFEREFLQDGRVFDYYEGQENVDQGQWVVFRGDDPVKPFPYPVESKEYYLSISLNTEYLFFKIADIESDKLDLIYLDRGGVLTFERVIPEIQY